MSFKEPTDAERAFYRAFVDRDLTAMRAVWIDAPAAACVHPGGGLLLGIEAIMASWRDIFSGTSAPRIRVIPVQTRIDRNIAVHIVEEHIESADQDRAATVIATNIFERVEQGWLMRLHHASLPLVEAPSAAPQATPLH
jgi:hypothetical protein